MAKSASIGNDLRWIVGIENAFIPDMGVDELSWTRHRDRWREDLQLARDVGASAVRYGITWPELEPRPGEFDWTWCDLVVDEFQSVGLEPIWDMVHFGVPAWLEGGFLDPEFPSAFAGFCREFAGRYRGAVEKLTPLNEPYITTYFRAGWGIWPPHLKGREGFVRMLHAVVEALRCGIRAIGAANPKAEIWLNDGADTYHPGSPELKAVARQRTEERYAAFDLLLGLTQPGSETYEWLHEAGYPAEALRHEPVEIDVIGLDYYPDTEHDISTGPEGEMRIEPAREPLGVGATLLDYWRRYGVPLFIAESSHSGTEEERIAWIDYNLGEIAYARDGGAEVIGYTWWPLFDHIDWNTLLRERSGFVCPAGLYHLRPSEAHRHETGASRAYRQRATGTRAQT
ncbi:MAG TPA: family 1 glycosylhydrolase [Trueperaceae bacterium]